MKQILLLATATIVGLSAISQKKEEHAVKPTAAAESAFKKAYPNATGAKWKSEEKDYEVEFKNEKASMSAVYAADGSLKETEERINVASLPAGVTSYVKQHYKHNIKAAEKVVKENGEINYEVEVGEAELIFDKDGKFLKEEKE